MKLSQLPPRLAVAAAKLTSLDQLPKQREAYYGSAQHKDWAKLVVGRANACCQSCGKHTKRLIADHIKERKDGGDPTDPANGWALCWACHNRKSAAARRARLLGTATTFRAGGG